MENKYEVFDWSAEFDIAINKLRAMAHLIEYCDIQECADYVGFDHGFPCLIQDLAEEFAFIVDHMDKEGPECHFRNSVYIENKDVQSLKTNDQEVKKEDLQDTKPEQEKDTGYFNSSADEKEFCDLVETRVLDATSILATVMGSISALVSGTLSNKDAETVLHGCDSQIWKAMKHLDKIKEKF